MPIRAASVEQVGANVEARSGIERNRRELDTHAVIARNGLMQHRLAMVGGAVMRPAAGQDQLKALATIGLLLSIVVLVSRRWPPWHPEPAWIILLPIDVFERHADDLAAQRAGAAPQQLFRHRMA